MEIDCSTNRYLEEIKQLAKENFRTVGGTITYLTEKEYESKKLVDEKV